MKSANIFYNILRAWLRKNQAYIKNEKNINAKWNHFLRIFLWHKQKKEYAGGKPISIPNKLKIKAIDKITNFNPSTDTLEIDTDSFKIDSNATFAAGKNKKVVKRQLAKLDIDFLYDQRRGGLYFNENGADKGFGAGGIIAVLKGAPDLTASNLSFT